MSKGGEGSNWTRGQKPRKEAELGHGFGQSMCSLGGITGGTYCFSIWRDRRSVPTPQLGKLRQKVQDLPRGQGP